MKLSAEVINQTAPYKVRQVEDGSFLFTTAFGVLYSVGFAPDYHFMEQGAYQFYLSVLEGDSSQSDKNVFSTVCAIIEEFFRQEPLVMLYFCDTRDGRQAYRDRKFKIWFHIYMNNDQFTMHNEQLVIDDIKYYAGLIIRNTHPLHNEIIQSFHNFVREIPTKLNNL